MSRSDWISTVVAAAVLAAATTAFMAGVHVAAALAGLAEPTWNPFEYAWSLWVTHDQVLPDGWVPWAVLFEALVLAVFIGGLISWGVWARRRRRAKGAHRDNSDGFAGGRDLQRRVDSGHLAESTTPYGYVDRKPVSARTEDTGASVAPPRSGKTMRLVVGRILDAIGACVTTSTRADVLRLTALARSKRGRVMVFDPEGLTAWPDRVRWNIVDGCADAGEATKRAAAMIAARPLDSGKNAGFFNDAANKVLRCLLHAAALGGHDMRTVMAWARDFEDDAPYNILRTHEGAATGWVQDLAKFCRAKAEETVASTDMSLSLVLDAFSNEHVLDAVCPAPGEPVVDPSQFYASTDTLYLLSESDQTSPSAPVITALVETIARAARRAATRTTKGRLPVPLTLVLDEVANVAPIPSLPQLMSEGGGSGIITWAITQSRSQLETRWGREGARTILNSASILLVLGGVKDTEFLEELSKLCDEREVQRTSETSSERGSSTSTSTAQERVMPVARIRQLPEGEALLLYRELAAAIVTLPAWWETKAKAECEASVTWALGWEGLLEAGQTA